MRRKVPQQGPSEQGCDMFPEESARVPVHDPRGVECSLCAAAGVTPGVDAGRGAIAGAGVAEAAYWLG